MNRRQSREQAFVFLFESTFGLQTAEEIIEHAGLAREEKISGFAKNLFDGVLANQETIDKHIEKNLNDWEKERLTRTTLSILRLSTFEIMFDKETPTSVSINEAVELAKKYSTKKEASYINGVLGSISKNLETDI
jgi:transcription antitermination protein NusB